MAPANVLITGCNRGIGLGLVHQFLKLDGVKHVFATARKPEEANELRQISDPRLVLLAVEVTDDKTIEEAVKKVETIVGSDGLNLLINNAGVVVPYDFTKEPNRVEFAKQLDINTTSPLIISQYFLPLLKKAASKGSGQSLSVSRAAIVNISSAGGSIARHTPDSTWYGWPIIAYRTSKCGVNMITRDMSLYLKDDGILVAAFCPGWVKTDLGTDAAELTVEDSTAQLAKSILKLTDRHTGNYYERDLEPIPF